MTQKERLQDTQTRTKPDSPIFTRLKNSHIVLGGKERQLNPTKDSPQKNRIGTYRMIIAAGIGIILLVSIIAIFAFLMPGFSPTGSGYSTVKGVESPMVQSAAVTVKDTPPMISTEQSSPVQIPPEPASTSPPWSQEVMETSVPSSQMTASASVPWSQETVSASPPPWSQEVMDTSLASSQATASASVPWSQETVSTSPPPWSQETVNETPPWVI